jgi:curved DNA-binding protein CbpA
VRKCHPDRVADLDEEIRRTAERRFREIREAYERLVGD